MFGAAVLVLLVCSHVSADGLVDGSYEAGKTQAIRCGACHGPTGRGNPAAAYPLLRGQHATYIAATLRAYATDERKSDGATRMMRDIAKRLTEDDILAVAAYMQGLR